MTSGEHTKGADFLALADRVEKPFSRSFAMPSKDTFSVAPIRSFVRKYLADAVVSVDPFARNNSWATYTNDINPMTSARCHLDAEEFCISLAYSHTHADLGIFDPPYSPRQVSECYRSADIAVTSNDTQNARLYKRVRDAMDRLIKPGGIVLSFGWNTNGMGKGRGYEIIEIVLVAHGGAHNDTICMAERKVALTRFREAQAGGGE